MFLPVVQASAQVVGPPDDPYDAADPGRDGTTSGTSPDIFQTENVGKILQPQVTAASASEAQAGACYTSVCLVIDVSGSMAGSNLTNAKNAANALVNLMGATDRAAVVSFSNCYTIVQGFTSNKTTLHNAINSLSAGGYTAAFDGIWAGVNLTTSELGSKAVIALTDGMENRSYFCSAPPDGLYDGFADDSTLIVGLAVSNNVILHTVALGSSFDPQYMIALAAGGGGTYHHSVNGSDLTTIYSDIWLGAGAPTITCPGDASYDCLADVPACDPNDASVAGGNPPYTVTCSSTDQGGAGCSGDPHLLTYTYIVTDDCGKADTCAQTITVADNTPPVLAGCPADATVECDNVPAPGSPTATDNCGGSVTITFSEDSTGSCPYTLTRTWVATDPCGNADTCVQVLTVEDTTAPTCSTINNATYQQCSPEEVCIPVSATDNCDNDVTCTVISGPGTVSGGNWCYTPSGSEVANVTIECTDDCGNTCQESFTVTFDLSNLPPVTTFTGGSSPPLCTPPIHVITYSSTDPNGDPVSCSNTNPSATLGANTWQYSPTPGEHVVDTIICCDPCGACDSLIIDITFPSPAPPICEVPADTSIFMCDPVQVCLPAFATGATCTVISGPGAIVGSDWCYTPSASEVANVTVQCAGICDTCTASFTVTFTVGTPPSITCPGDLTFACDADVPACDPNDATVTGGTAPVTVTCSSSNNGLDGCPGGAKIYTYTYIATDNCGKADTCTQTITVIDDVAPTVTCPANLTVECDASTDPASTGTATATDNCAGAVTVAYSDAEAAGACANAKTITRTWTATDACGNTASCDQIITVDDTTNPTIACPAGIAVECVADIPAADINSVTASDNCGPVTVTWEGDGALVGGPCGGTITRTYRATDACGNTADCTQTITIEDTTNPTITCPADITVECVADVPAADVNSVTAADNCGNPTVTWEGDGALVGGACGGTITRTYRATDGCGNFVECTQTITVHDQTNPTIACPADITVECVADVPPPDVNSVTAADNCGSVTVTHEGDAPLSGGPCGGTIARTYRATDGCGNFVECTQTITVHDQTNPTIACPADITVECLADVPPADVNSVTAADNCGSVTVTHVSDGALIGGPCGGTIDRIYRAVDPCGNFVECTQTITVNDQTDPTITCPSDITVQCVTDIPTPDVNAVSASDNCGSVTVTHLSDSPIVAGQMTRTYEATDACGNTAQCTQTITIDDTTPPTIACPADMDVECIGEIPSPDVNSVTAGDNCGSVTVTHVQDGAFIGGPCGGTITRTYRATDAAGNTTDCDQVFTINDVTPPTIGCPAPITVACEADVPPADINSVTASDNCGSAQVTWEGDTQLAGGACGGTITRTYRATDVCGNIAECTQIITVNDDVDPTIACPAAITVDCEADVPAADINSVTAADNCGSVTVTWEGDSQLAGGPCGGTITRTYRATDLCGNFAECTQTITVHDQTDPTIACPAGMTVECVGDIPAADINLVTASDNCGSVTVTWEGDGSLVGDGCGGTITRTYRATDACGNFAECTQTITIDDNTNPTIACPTDITVECEADVPAADVNSVTADDNCGSVTVTWEGDSPLAGGPCGGTITRTYRATDLCGNIAECTQTITIHDYTPPVITVVPDTTIFLCDPTEVCIPFTATDNCNGPLDYYLGPSPNGSTISPGMWCYTPTENIDRDVYLIVQDQCTNGHTEIFHIKIVLNEPPVCSFQAPTPGACAPSNLVVPITSTDPEGGPTDCQLVSGPGTLVDGVWSYSPAPGEAFSVVIHCYDTCGAYCEASFDYTTPNPDPPVCVLPTSDQNFDLCQPGQISVPVSATGGAGAVTCQVVSGPGSISGGQWSYNATTDESFTVTVECSDACGVTCDGSFNVNINVNAPPVCNGPGDMTIEKCDLTEIVLPMTATDPDGNLAGCQVISGPGTVSGGTWRFTPPAFGQYCVTVQCSDDCGATCEASFCVDVVQRVDCQCLIDVSVNGGMNIDALNDQTVTVPITIDDMHAGLEIGGFDLLICYDRTAIAATQVSDGAAIADWEYFTYRNGINSNCGSPGCPSGILRVVGIADLDNGPTVHPPTSAFRPIGSVADISFRVTSDRNFIGQCIPIAFCWYDCGDNTISSRTGDTLFVQLNGWDPSCLSNPKVEPLPGICFDSAAICIQEPPDDRGDINLNFIANEVGDAVLYSQYFIFGESVFDPVWKNSQILASDVNDDGIVLTVADLIYMIRIITGDAQAYPADPGSPKVAPYMGDAEVSYSVSDGRALISTNSTSELGGAVLVFRYSGLKLSEPELLTTGASLQVRSQAKNGELRVLITPEMTSHSAGLPIGQNDLISIPLEGDGVLELVEAQVSDADGALLTSKLIKSAAAVPGSYALYQNFPNPFNAGTVIRFDLKDASDWTLNVYNVAGQVVRTFNGRNEASRVSIQWDGRDRRGHDLASGVYFYRVTAAGFTATKKMTLLK